MAGVFLQIYITYAQVNIVLADYVIFTAATSSRCRLLGSAIPHDALRFRGVHHSPSPSAKAYVHCASSIIHHPSCIMHRESCIVHRASCIVHRASCIVHCASCIVHRESCIVHRASCIVHCALCIVHRASCIVHCASCIVHCASCIVHRASCIFHHPSCIICWVGGNFVTLRRLFGSDSNPLKGSSHKVRPDAQHHYPGLRKTCVHAPPPGRNIYTWKNLIACNHLKKC